MRKLVSIQKIEEVRPIPGADNIEVAQILGWEVVVKKGEFRAGDLCAYFEIDSFLPERPEFEFLRKSCFKTYCGKPGFRLKTIKLKGQISQGLALPLKGLKVKSRAIDTDLTSALGVIKFDTDLSNVVEPKKPKKWWHRWLYRLRKLFGISTRRWDDSFPDFIPKTDETRVQNMGKEIQKWEGIGATYFVTEKLDGSSWTAYRRGKKIGVCSRNLNLKKDPNNKWWRAATKNNIEGVLKDFGSDIAIQGELIGPGIQENKYGFQNYEVYVFNIWDIEKRRYWLPVNVMEFCSEYGLMYVPVEPVQPVEKTIPEILRCAEGPSKLNPKQEREGVVYVTLKDGVRLGSFKAISNRFLLK